MITRFVAGTFARIEAVLDKDEDRTDFVREAVERELKRRSSFWLRRQFGNSTNAARAFLPTASAFFTASSLSLHSTK